MHVSARTDGLIGQEVNTPLNKSNHGNLQGGCDVSCLKVVLIINKEHVCIINVFHVIVLPVFGAFLMNIKFGVILYKD